MYDRELQKKQIYQLLKRGIYVKSIKNFTYVRTGNFN